MFSLSLILGYNNYKGFLDSIEKLDMPTGTGTGTWSELPLKLKKPKAYSCATTIKYKGSELILVVGGWDSELKYVADVEIFNHTYGGDGNNALVSLSTIEMPADKSTDPSRTKGRSDVACMEFRYDYTSLQNQKRNNLYVQVSQLGGGNACVRRLQRCWCLAEHCLLAQPDPCV